MRKLREMKIRDYVDRLLEISNYLKYLPDRTGEAEATVLPDNEIMDILMYGIPNTWQKKIVELNFDNMPVHQMSSLNCVSAFLMVNQTHKD